MRRLLTDGALSLEGPAGVFGLSGSGPALVLSAPSVRALSPGLRFGVWRGTQKGSIVRRLDISLRHAGLVLELRIGRRTVARLGNGTRASRLAGWLGLGPVELKPVSILAALASPPVRADLGMR